MTRIIPPDLSNWHVGLIILAFLFALTPPVAAQSSIPNNPGETFSKLKRAVVIITTVNRQGKPLLQGSGFFVSADLIVTNLHVIREAALIKIEMFDGVTRNMQNVVAVNEKEDLALLQLERTEADVEFLELADSTPAEGERILVMSNPRGCHWKLTQGEVGPTWQFKDTGKRIQITALILPGSSGGPVVNQEGRVVGIAAMHMEGEDYLNFAVPAESLRTLQAVTSLASVHHSASGQ